VPEREVRINHVFDAPREAVFEAWTDPDQVAMWWAPEGLEIPRDSVVIELRVGGRFHLTMVESAGERRFPLRAEILEIAPPELLVMRSEPLRRPASPTRRSPASSSRSTAPGRG
jgi:uncharacterized protein YndB with AHSA1/START domain